ncbi:hypothetical protein KKJ10_09000 [Xenorhabdus bovienii]|nr:hypothetical protein [Xenorhabdus bovienii]MDE9432188.1 hypothetical protein [Xenorhabdus bovienii]MDE9490149.1 hypothetical protein [Xenorhabdus bovienii]MDE9506425.1 hypothetical protein [Xenorhabdus bovienii]MDE9546557.1 hypothetical protein [Xenorhabdus bovienii]
MCGHIFQLDYSYRACQVGIKEQIIDLVLNDSGIRYTAWTLHISINAAVRTLKGCRHEA